MPHLEYFVVAETYSVDQSTNRVSLFHVLEEIAAVRLPTQVNCAAAAAWDMAPEDRGQEFGVTVVATLPGGSPYVLQANFVANRDRHRAVIQMQGLPITAVGDLVFTLQLNGQEQAHHRVTVRQARPDELGIRLPDAAPR